MKIYSKICFFNVFRILDGELPRVDCDVKFVPIDYFDLQYRTDIVTSFNFPEGFYIIPWMFMFVMGSAIAILFVELMDKKFLYLVTPLCDIIEKRYATVKERNRLLSMNGHP